MKYQYMATSPKLPPKSKRLSPSTPVMDHNDMEYWLNDMDKKGWEFVGTGAENWNFNCENEFIQRWWIFRKPRPKE